MLKEKLKKFKIPIITFLIIIVIVTGIFYPVSDTEENTEEPIIEKKETKKKEAKTETIKVDLKGEVTAQGVYEMTNEDRISDLINKAGGLTKNADTSLLNLSKKLEDEMVIIIYSKAEVIKIKNNKKTETVTCPEVNDACITTEKVDDLTENKTTKNATTSGKISINTASESELQTLSGIGEAKAKAIINYREKNGKFETIEDIKNVSGIGDALFEKIKDNISV